MDIDKTNLYAICTIFENDKTKYRYLSLRDNLQFLKDTSSGGDPQVFISKYKPPEVYWEASELTKEIADTTPCPGFHLTFTAKAHDILKPYLNANGVVVEISFGSVKFYGYRTWKRFSDIESHEKDAEFVFNDDKKTNLFVSEKVKDLIESAGLTGFKFEKRT